LPTEAANYLDPHVLASITPLELRARMAVEGLMIGMHRSPYQGFSIEFAQHRPYTPGDDLRHLDWKVMARTDKLHLKQYQKETNLDLVILVDISGSMGFRSDDAPWNKYDLAASVAASIAFLAQKQQDRASLTVFSDRLHAATRLSNSHDHWRTIAALLGSQDLSETPIEEDAPNTDLARLFDQVLAKLTRRSLVVLVSDLFDSTDHIERALARVFHRRHDLMILQTLDPAERDLPFRSPSQFVGMENEGKLNLDPAALRKAYNEAIAQHLDRIAATARKFHFDHAVIDSSESLGPALSQYLAQRAASIGKRK